MRRAFSREKRQNLILHANESKEDDDADNNEYSTYTTTTNTQRINDKIHIKTDKEKEIIANYLMKNFLFQHLSISQLNNVVNVMYPIIVKANDYIIKQGDKGEEFYIIDNGIYDVRVISPITTPTLCALGGDVVYTYESTPDIHPGFGELSLMYGKPRAASVIARTDGKLWALDRRIFRSIVLRSIDSRKNIIRTLKKVELFHSLSIQQIQRLADLLHEIKYKAGEYIIKQGDIGDSFYIILNGICNCTKNSEEKDQPETLLVQRRAYEYFGERALLNEEPRAANVIAYTDVKLLYISKIAFDEVLGTLSDIINDDRIRRETLANAILQAPMRLEGIELRAVVSSDNLGPILLGSFKSATPNLCIRTFLLSAVDEQGLSDSVTNFIEAVRLVTLNKKVNPFVPKLHSASRDTNAIHLLYRSPVVADLSTICQLNNRSNTLLCSPVIHVYISACIVSALETLHSMGIIYRTCQPESVYIDINGKVVLMDYRVCKILPVGGKTYTICGASDYLAPEQISQVGHTSSVDLWSLGVLLHELVVGKHPFASNMGEIATYTKITSFGTSAFPTLSLPEETPSDAIEVIKSLIRVDPDQRLGSDLSPSATSPYSFQALKALPYFSTIDWSDLNTKPSPLKMIAEVALDDLLRGGFDETVKEGFGRAYTGGGWDKKLELCR